MAAIELDDQMCGRAQKVHHVRSDHGLTPEVCAGHGEFF
jgi:hypothetical protein